MRLEEVATNYVMAAIASACLAVPRPKPPPPYPDLYGRRREITKLQKLEREGCELEEELKFVQDISPASVSCKEVTEFLLGTSDPLVPTSRTPETGKLCRFWRCPREIANFMLSHLFSCGCSGLGCYKSNARRQWKEWKCGSRRGCPGPHSCHCVNCKLWTGCCIYKFCFCPDCHCHIAFPRCPKTRCLPRYSSAKKFWKSYPTRLFF